MVRSPRMLLAAYGSVYANRGALTPGSSGETAEGMSEDKILALTEALATDEYWPEPVRRTYIPKPSGRGQRPLGLPSFSDKLVGQAIAWILEAIWEPRFSDASTGFRPGRSVHDALGEIGTWCGTVWFIEGDIEDCFGSIDHDSLISILAETIRDQRFLDLVRRFLEAGYLEAGRWRPTRSGAAQGSPLSPILANIYLHELDRFVVNELVPVYTKGAGRRSNREYARISGRVRRARAAGDEDRARVFERQRRTLRYGDPMDPGFRRLRYVRYCDDFLLGFIGSRAEAEQIRGQLREWLSDRLQLRLSLAKTKVTHAKRQKARFLGHEIFVRAPKSGNNPAERGVVSFQVPGEVIRADGGHGLVRTRPGGR
jgi:group II intron reverse transcriptase/maturase